MSHTKFAFLKAVVFDWAGTTIDYGSCAPAAVFQEIFRRQGIHITPEQAREPMGRAKKDHIAAIGRMPEVDRAWRAAHAGQSITEGQIDQLYAEFLPLQQETLGRHCQLIDGVPQLADWCRARQLKIGSTTGYTRELLQTVLSAAREQGYEPDCALGAEDARFGRPAPFLLFEAAQRMGVYPMWHMVKVDDTPVGIQAGRHAGCWTIGITQTGNGVGLSQQEWERLDATQQADCITRAEGGLRAAGAHALARSVADIREILIDFDDQLARGRLPI